MKLLALLSSFLLLAAAKTDYGYGNHDGDGRTYTYSESHVSNGGRDVKNVDTTYTDNSIHRNGANFKGASNVFIGSNDNVMDEDTLPQWKRSVDTAAEASSRQKRWGIGFKSGVQNSHSTHTDNSIHMNGANFGDSQNVVIGHGNRLSKRDTYNQQYDNSIKIKDFYVHGSAAINIGHNNRHKKDVELVGEKAVGEEELSRVKRWGLFGAKSNVQNHHHSHTDNSIHMNGANFAGSNSVVVGHGNRLSKRSVNEHEIQGNVEEEQQDGENKVEGEDELSRIKRWSLFGVKSKVENHHSTHTDNRINMNNANFANSQNVVIGHGNRLSKRSVNEQSVEEDQLSRQKRWGFKLKSGVTNTHTEKTDNSIHMERANFRSSQNVVIGHGNRLSKRSVNGQEDVKEEQLSRQKRWGFGLKSGVGNSHSTHTDNSIHMNHANFRNSQNVVIGHGNHGK